MTLDERYRRHLARFADKSLAPKVLLAAFLAASVSYAQATPGATPAPARLRSETITAFDRYVRLTDERNDMELKRGSPLLWIDSLPETQRAERYAALKRGEVHIHQLVTLDSGKPIVCPSGMIHHWVGAIFIPGARLDDVLGVLQDYDHQSEYYTPDVERSQIESRDGDHFRVFLRFRRHKVITVVLDTEHEVRYFHDAMDRAHSRSSAMLVA